MQNETSTAENPIGLYKDPSSGKYTGAIHPAQADAMVRQGYKLVKEGQEAAMYSEKQISEILAAAGQTEEPEAPAPDPISDPAATEEAV